MAQIIEKVGGEVLVNTTTEGSQFQPTIAGLPGGGFVASWRDDSGTGGDASGAGIKAQVFDGAGQKIGGEVLVNTETDHSQHQPAIVGLPDGGFVVSWGEVSGVGGDASGYGVKAQLFDAAGQRVGGKVLINTTTAHDQWKPTIAARPDGFVVSWSDYSGMGRDADSYGIKAQLLRLAKANAAPVANDGSQAGPESTAIAGRVTAVDPDGDALSYTLVQGAQDADGQAVAGLTVHPAGSYSFQGPRDFHGTVSFNYAASDGLATSSTATMTLTVTPANDAPIAHPNRLDGVDQTHIYDGAAGRIDVTALLANDADVDGEALRFAGVASGPCKGTLDVVTEENRTFLVYEYEGPRLALGGVAIDTFTYRVADASGATSTATVSLTVTGLPGRQADGTAGSTRSGAAISPMTRSTPVTATTWSTV